MTIPGVQTYHPRTEWEQDGYRMATDFTRAPTRITLRNVDVMVAHYTGAKNMPDGDPGESMTNVRDVLRAVERDYLNNRAGGGYTRKSDGRYFPGYHTGYSFAVDWLGGVWEIRGLDYLPAATNNHNSHTVAVLFLTDADAPATAPQWASARAIGQHVRRLSQRGDFKRYFTDHGSLTVSSGQGTATACSGRGIRSQLKTEGDLDRVAPKPEPPAPPKPTDPMENDVEVAIITVTGTNASFIGYRVRQITNGTERVFVLWMEWVDGTDQLQLDRYETYKRMGVPNQTLAIADCRGVGLLGPIPTGDGLRVWSRSDFGNVMT